MSCDDDKLLAIRGRRKQGNIGRLTSSRGSSAHMGCRWHHALAGPNGATSRHVSQENMQEIY